MSPVGQEESEEERGQRANVERNVTFFFFLMDRVNSRRRPPPLNR